MNTISEEKLFKEYEEYFGEKPLRFFSMGGRIEIIGNHTDHNHGLCIVATSNLSIGAAVNYSNNELIVIKSNGYKDIIINSNQLSIQKSDYGSSSGLIKGVIDYLTRSGFKVGGFLARVDSNIPQGSGLSSSAAYELLFAEIINQLFNDGKIDKLTLAKAGQYAENTYFGKKSGLLDQIGVSYGGINVIDFKNIENPTIASIDFPFSNVHFVLINNGSSHADLTSEYSSIPESMHKVAEHFGKKFLRDVPEAYFRGELEEEKEHGHSHFDYLDKKRAIHFFEENKRVLDCLKAIKEKNEDNFFKALNESQHSSQNNLCNTQVGNRYKNSPQEAIDYASAFIERGAIRIHGGGFAGTVIAFIVDEEFEDFMKKMKNHFGNDNVIELNIKY